MCSRYTKIRHTSQFLHAFNALKTLHSFTILNEIRLNPKRLNVLKIHLNAEKLQAFEPVALKLI